MNQLEAVYFPNRICEIHADWRGEFQNNNLKEETKQRGCQLKDTISYYSETNAIIKRTNRKIITTTRTAIIGTHKKLSKTLWNEAAGCSAYTKNQIPHKSLKRKSSIQIIFPKKSISDKWKNLRHFGQLVTCYNYTTKDKLSLQSYRGRIVGYTPTCGVYQVVQEGGWYRVAKNPTPVPEEGNDSSSDEESKWEDHKTPKEKPEKEPKSQKPKRHMKTAKEFTKLYGSRKSTQKWGQIKATDSSSEQETRTRDDVTNWLRAQESEREQLRTYGVYSVINKQDIPENTKIVDTKWVYKIKRGIDGGIAKYKARKVGRGFNQEYGVN